MGLQNHHPLEQDEVHRYQDQLYTLEQSYRKLEKKYRKLQMKYQDRMWVIRKQNKRIQKLEGNKLGYHNDPVSVRKAKGKRK